MSSKHMTILKPESMVLAWEGLRIYVARITPADAVRLLELNKQNRTINTSQVDRLTDAMLKDHWKLTHQGIAFDSDGVLIDGQHRLLAIVESGKAQLFLVCEGFDPVTRVDIDQMWTRQLKDSLRIMGVVARPEVAASVIGAITRYGHGDNVKIDFETAKGLIIRYKVGIEWASVTVPVGRTKGFTTASVLGAFAYAYPHAPNATERAWRDLNSGAIGDEDDAVLRLRNQILAGDSRGRSTLRNDTTRAEVFFKTLNALCHRTNNTTTRVLKPSDVGWRFFSEKYQENVPSLPTVQPPSVRVKRGVAA